MKLPFPPIVIDADELEERLEKERTNYVYKKLSEKERVWSQEAMKKCMQDGNGKISRATIESLELCEEVKKKFGKKISAGGLYSRFYGMNPQYRHKRKGNAAEISNYLVFVKLTGQTAGFETEDEVKEFIEKNQILGNDNIRIFKHMPTTVKYDIKIGV